MSFSYRADQDEEPGYTHNITGVAVSNSALLVVSTLGFGALGIALYFLVLRRLSQGGDDAQADADRGREDAYGEMLDQSDVATLNRAQRRLRAKRRMKNARRVATTPGQQQQAERIEGEREVMEEEGDVREVANAQPNLSRKERQRAAKAMEKEERKAYANEARLRRERTQSALKSEGSSKEKKSEEPANKSRELSVEELFPQRESDDDALSEQLFWGTICKSIRQRSQSYDDTLSMIQRIPRRTVRAFIDSLKQNGSVSIATLADEFGISISDAQAELETLNTQHGVVGVVADGNFIYVSMEMIREAVKLGKEAGRIPSPMELSE